ncbi:hypothetical protein H4S08_002298 [Coemansia sp. RSA 1365]|nr:hypothetical protein H4S08_002298 [Coemansia sp. RSA 1365]
MQSDDEDSQQPKTLAERIARLGLKTGGGTRPTSRASTEVGSSDGRTTPMQSVHNPMGAETRPPIAPKPHMANRPYAGSLSFQAGYTHDEVKRPATQPPHTDMAAAVQAQHGTKTSAESHGDETSVADIHSVSVRDRIQSLYRERGSLENISLSSATTAQSQAPIANPNPFASPELSNTQVMAAEEDSSGGIRPMSPVSPLPAAAHDLGRPRTNFARHSLSSQPIIPGGISPPPQKPATMQHTRTIGRRIDGDDRHTQPQRPMSALGASNIFGQAIPKIPPKPAGIGTPKVGLRFRSQTEMQSCALILSIKTHGT